MLAGGGGVNTINLGDRGNTTGRTGVVVTNHTALQMVTFINKDFFDSLPADLQDVVMEATAKTTAEQRKIAIEVDELAMQIMKDAGMEINEPSAEFTAAMIAATKPVVDGYRTQIDAKLFELAGL